MQNSYCYSTTFLFLTRRDRTARIGHHLAVGFGNNLGNSTAFTEHPLSIKPYYEYRHNYLSCPDNLSAVRAFSLLPYRMKYTAFRYGYRKAFRAEFFHHFVYSFLVISTRESLIYFPCSLQSWTSLISKYRLLKITTCPSAIFARYSQYP